MPAFAKLATSLALAALVSACSHSRDISRLATNYNAAMAESRDQQLLLNILRAGAREPLQFSAIGEITRTGSAGGSLSTEATNLIAGGADAISPTLGLELSSSPVVKVTPLSNKEFTEGLLRPTAPETLNLFINQGWDTEFLLPLTIGGIRCPGEPRQRLTRRGIDFDRSAEEFNLRRSEASQIELTVSNEQALQMLRSGVTDGLRIHSVSAHARDNTVSVVVLKDDSRRSWLADVGARCPNDPSFGFDPASRDEAFIQLRSVEGIIYHLGAAVRRCVLGLQEVCYLSYTKTETGESSDPDICEATQDAGDEDARNRRYLFRLQARENQAPVDAAVAVRFHGRNFWIDRLDQCDRDRSLKTLNFVSQLIALQTSGSDLAVTPSVISVGR